MITIIKMELSMIQIRNSRQRNRILELLKDTDVHPTADWIYNKLKAEFPNLSLGTVYRNLNMLAEQGLIRKIDFGSTYDRYDANTDQHYHFVCEKCKKIIDLDMPADEKLNEKIKEKTGYRTYRHRIEFFGVCDKCEK